MIDKSDVGNAHRIRDYQTMSDQAASARELEEDSEMEMQDRV